MPNAARRPGLAIVLAVVFLDLLGFGIIVPILPYYTRAPGRDGVRHRATRGLLFGDSVPLRAAARVAVGSCRPPTGAGALPCGVGGRLDRLGLGFIFGPGIGAVSSFDTTVAFFSLCVVALFFLPASRTPAADPEAGRAERPSAIAQLRAAVTTAGLRELLTAFFLVSFAFSGVTVMFIPYVADVYGFSATQSALSLAYIGALPVSRTLGALFPDLTGDVIGLVAVLTLLPVGNGILSVTLTALVSGRASADRQGSAFGVTQGAGSLARTVGPPVMGGLYAAVGYWAPFVVGSLLLVPVLALVARLGPDTDAADSRPADPGHVR